MNFLPKRLLLISALASIGALSAASDAAATVEPPVVVGHQVTITSSPGAGDTIALTAVGGEIVVNTTATGLTADNQAEIVVNAGDGVDTVIAGALAATDYKSLVVNGGEGDDTIGGGGGNDRLLGDKGEDTLFGDAGNDFMIWNPGDGTDTDQGDEGVDKVEVNGGAAAETFTYKPGPLGVRFDRTSGAAPFGIDFEAEQLTINGSDGNDAAAPDLTAPGGLQGLTFLTLNGGNGDDSLTGGDGDDQIHGDAGNDRLVGFKGNDTLQGGEGDDVMVWNPGDGSDIDTGEAGSDEVEVNGGAAAETFTYKPDNLGVFPKGVRFDRTPSIGGPVAFGIDLEAERLTVNLGGGDDAAGPLDGPLGTVLAGRTAITVNGDDGNDSLTGGEGDDNLSGGDGGDNLFGGAGKDTLTPGPGSDLADGQAGDDRLIARDGASDLVRGGGGNDSAQTDAVTIDSVSDIEALDATPPPAPTPPPPPPPPADTKALLPTLGKAKATGKGRKLVVQVPVSCPAAETGGCQTSLTLQTAKAARLGAVRAVVVLGSTTVKLDPGGQATASIRLAAGATGLAKGGVLPTRVLIASVDAAGNAVSGSAAASLQIPHS